MAAQIDDRGGALIAAVRATFPPGRPLRADEITACDCPDCFDVRAALAGKTWPELPAATLYALCTKLCVLTPTAFGQMLPAFVVRGLESPEEPWGVGEVLEFVTYVLLPREPEDWWRALIDPFDAARAACVLEVLRHVHARDASLRESAPAEALRVWAAKTTA